MTKQMISLAVTALLSALSASAHHNAASHYELDRTMTVTGVVTRFLLINPHARIYFNVTSDDGKTEPWLAEGNAAAILKRRGWSANSLHAGDKITITGRPARDGGNKIDWETIALPDGTTLRGGNTVGGEYERQLDELDDLRRQRRDQENNAENGDIRE